MKRTLSTLIILLFVSSIAFASKTEKFKVYGNCGMCENRIEKAVSEIDGVNSADWNKDTKMLEVTFDESKTSLKLINKAIAEVGHDTDMYRAKDEVYNNLPGCCHYDRVVAKNGKKMDDCKMKSDCKTGKSCCGEGKKLH